MKQTAVEWLATYLKGITSLDCDEVIEQAIEMEKQQIIDSCNAGLSGIPRSSKQYYNETFKNTEQ